jgi:hypothetical protein
MAIIKLNATVGLTGDLPAVSGANLLGISSTGLIRQIQKTVGGFSGRNLESTSFVSTDLTKSITPNSSSNKILIYYQWEHKFNASSEGYGTAIHRSISGGSSGNISDSEQNQYNYLTASSSELRHVPSLLYVDEPNTTSAITYTMYVKGHTTSRVEISPQQIILFEITG